MTEIKSGKNEFYIEESGGSYCQEIHFVPSGTDVNGRDSIIVRPYNRLRRPQWPRTRQKTSK